MQRSDQERYRIAETSRDIGYDLAFILQVLSARLIPGMTGKDVDKFARVLIKDMGYESSCLNYHGFPASICISPNSVVVHGIPSHLPFKVGDVVKLDLAINRGGVHADAAVTVPVGKVSEEATRVMRCSYEALMAGASKAKTGNKVSDITAAIDAVVQSYGLKAYRDFGGHGIGASMHEDPFIGNVPGNSKDHVLQENQLICLEPIVTTGDGTYSVDADGWTIRGNGIVAQFEHTVRVNGFIPEPYTEWAPEFFERMFGFKQVRVKP
jgi:methionyl aminopeptidase